MQSEMGAMRASVSGGEKVQEIHLVWKSDGKSIRGFGFGVCSDPQLRAGHLWAGGGGGGGGGDAVPQPR